VFDQQTQAGGRRAHAAGKTIEIAVYGGSALMLTYDWRLASKDVDALIEANRHTIRRRARDIAVENHWDPKWLNDGVMGFLSAAEAQSRGETAVSNLSL
jgi:hypothetical protein